MIKGKAPTILTKNTLHKYVPKKNENQKKYTMNNTGTGIIGRKFRYNTVKKFYKRHKEKYLAGPR